MWLASSPAGKCSTTKIKRSVLGKRFRLHDSRVKMFVTAPTTRCARKRKIFWGVALVLPSIKIVLRGEVANVLSKHARDLTIQVTSRWHTVTGLVKSPLHSFRFLSVRFGSVRFGLVRLGQAQTGFLIKRCVSGKLAPPLQCLYCRQALLCKIHIFLTTAQRKRTSFPATSHLTTDPVCSRSGYSVFTNIT